MFQFISLFPHISTQINTFGDCIIVVVAFVVAMLMVLIKTLAYPILIIWVIQLVCSPSKLVAMLFGIAVGTMSDRRQ